MPVWYHGGDARTTIGWFHGAGVLTRTGQPPRRDLVPKPGRPYRSRPQETGRNGYLAASRRGRWTVLEIEMLLDSHFQAFLSRFCPIEGISAKTASSRCTSIDTFDLAPPSEHPGSFYLLFEIKIPWFPNRVMSDPHAARASDALMSSGPPRRQPVRRRFPYINACAKTAPRASAR